MLLFSAKDAVLLRRPSFILDVKTRKSKDPRTVPCGTPEMAGDLVEVDPSTATYCLGSSINWDLPSERGA